MWTTNAGLTDRHNFDSRPDSWPRLRRGIVSFILFALLARLNAHAFHNRTSGSKIIARFTSLVTL